MAHKGMQDMTAATTAALAFVATFGSIDQRGQPSPGLLAPCLGLALVAGAALWVGLGSLVVLLAA
jgi:hypothetical protein